MHVLLLATIFLYTVTYTRATCFTFNCGPFVNLAARGKNCSILSWSEFDNCANISSLILSHNSIEDVKISTGSKFDRLIKLDMSHNKLQKLPDNFLHQAVSLEEIDLRQNMLQVLPNDFLLHSSNLKILSLEGNSLSNIPSSIFHSGLRNLTVDCKCDVAESTTKGISILCNNVTNCLGHSFKCQMASGWSNLEQFYQNECRTPNHLLILYIVLPIALLSVIAGGVIFYMCRKKKSTTNLQNKEISHKSPAHGQPRYTTRNMDSISTAADRFRDPKQDYENVIVGQLQPTKIKPYDHLKEEGSHHGKSNAIIEDDNIYLESDVNDQPIYSNTQALYYDYTDPTSNLNKEQDDVYILPDQ